LPLLDEPTLAGAYANELSSMMPSAEMMPTMVSAFGHRGAVNQLRMFA